MLPFQTDDTPIIDLRDQLAYDGLRIEKLKQVLRQQNDDAARMYRVCDKELQQAKHAEYQSDPNDLLVAHLIKANYLRIHYVSALRWLKLLRCHQGELCEQGFYGSAAKMVVSDRIIYFANYEADCRPVYGAFGIPVEDLRRQYQ